MSLGRGWFITGTDTGVGKTHIACALMRALALRGNSVAGMKPVASGCRATSTGLRSADAEALLGETSIAVNYEETNPYAFAPATAPHLAAAASGIEVRIDTIASCYATLASRAQCVVVEGIGGWLVPIGPQMTMADVAGALDLPVILVVGVRLGALNHALLTVRAINACGMRLAAWVANRIDPDPLLDGYLQALRERIGAPLLGAIPYSREANAMDNQSHLDLAPLLP